MAVSKQELSLPEPTKAIDTFFFFFFMFSSVSLV